MDHFPHEDLMSEKDDDKVISYERSILEQVDHII